MRLGRRAAAIALAVAMLATPSAGAFVWLVNDATPLPDGTIPKAKETPDEFAVFDDTITDYMQERGITSASFAVAVDGEEVWRQGYGWMRPNTDDASPVVSPDSLFRIASITKPHTMTVIRHLADEGRLSFDDRVFCFPRAPSNCHLDIDPYDGYVDDYRIADITIRDVFDHRGGWDRMESGDVMFQNEEVADAMGVPSPPTIRQIAQYQVAQPLDFSPGSERAYSNFGYAMLGLIIETVTDDEYIDQVKHIVYDVPLDEVGTAEEDGVDVETGRTLTPHRNEREPTYHCPGLTNHVFDPIRQTGALTCWPDGGWALEPQVGGGNLIASAPELLDFGTRYWVWGEERDGSCGNCWGYFFGSLDGTLTLIQQRTDGLTFVILLNKRWDPEHGLHFDIQTVLDEAADQYMAQNHEDREDGQDGPLPSVVYGDLALDDPRGHAVDRAVHQRPAATLQR